MTEKLKFPYQPSVALIEYTKAFNISLFLKYSSKNGATGFSNNKYLYNKIGNWWIKKLINKNKKAVFIKFLFLYKKKRNKKLENNI